MCFNGGIMVEFFLLQPLISVTIVCKIFKLKEKKNGKTEECFHKQHIGS